jgi:transcriptional regulator with XRE-family HTH domain
MMAAMRTVSKRDLYSIDSYLGSRVRMRRVNLSITQEQLADALGISFQQVQKYENGTNRFSVGRLQQISDILQVPVPFFFEGADRRGVGPAAGRREWASGRRVRVSLAISDGLALAKAFMQIGDMKLRRTIVEIIQELTSADGWPRL